MKSPQGSRLMQGKVLSLLLPKLAMLELTGWIGFQHKKLPTTYLGTPLFKGRVKAAYFNLMI